MLDLVVKVIVSVLALELAEYLVIDGRLPFGLTGVLLVAVAGRKVEALGYQYRHNRTYYQLSIARCSYVQ